MRNQISQRIKEWQKNNPEKVLENIKQTCIKIKCLETNIIYNSISEASRLLNIDRKSINRCILKQQKTAGNLHWVEASSLETIEDIETFFEQNKTNTVKIKCIETNEIFFSIASAKRKYKGDIQACLKGRQKTAGKNEQGVSLHWEYIED